MAILTSEPLGPQLYENPNCDVALLLHGRQTTSSCRFTSNCDYTFLNIGLIFPEAGDYRMVVDYSAADGPLRVTLNGDHCDLPEVAGGSAEVLFTVGSSFHDDVIVFNDLGNATCAVTSIRIYEG